MNRRRRLSLPQPPRSDRRDVWNFYLSEIGLSVSAGASPRRRGRAKPKQALPAKKQLSPLAARIIEIAERRGCTIDNARRIADRERRTANAV